MEIKYSKEFEKKRKLVNTILKNSKGKEDTIILERINYNTNINNAFNPEYNYKDERRVEKLKGTYLKDLSQKELLNKFLKDEFNNMSLPCIESLFQEVYNRQAKENGCEPRYIIETRGNSDGAEGYVIRGENRLNINYDVIKKYMNIETTENKYDRNANTIGVYSLLNVVDETNLSLQSENVMNFVLGNDKDNPEKRAKTAITIAKDCLAYYFRNYYRDYNKNDEQMKKLYSLFMDNRENDFIECNSNIETFKYINKYAKVGYLADKRFLRIGKQRIVNDLHLENCKTKSEMTNAFSEKVNKMEEIVNDYYNLFNNIIKDGEIKNSVSQVLGEYLKVDENGKSQFNKDLNNDFKQCVDYMKNIDGKQSKLYRKRVKDNETEYSM